MTRYASLIYLLIIVGSLCMLATATAAGVPLIAALPAPSAAPSCAANSAGMFSDPNGNVYACAGTSRVLVARAASPVFATATVSPTLTPTPTVTSTP